MRSCVAMNCTHSLAWLIAMRCPPSTRRSTDFGGGITMSCLPWSRNTCVVVRPRPSHLNIAAHIVRTNADSASANICANSKGTLPADSLTNSIGATFTRGCRKVRSLLTSSFWAALPIRYKRRIFRIFVISQATIPPREEPIKLSPSLIRQESHIDSAISCKLVSPEYLTQL